MQILSANGAAEKIPVPTLDFRHVRNSLTYDDMRLIREELSEFFQLRGIARAHNGNLLLVVTEILSNLVKHPSRKADYIEIRVSPSERKLTMEVLDNSSPFANFDAKCKSALSRLQSIVTGEESGYGLGCILSINKSPQYICQDSSPDHLNHFRISLDTGTPSPEEKKWHKEKTGKKIFLIDDDPVSLHIHQRMLEKVYEVVCFEKAEQALAAFPLRKPDLIISDLTMPGMDGIGLREALAGVADGDITPFIFLSGHSDSEHNPYISHLGVDNFLCKPVSRERLLTVLARLLQRSQQVRASMHGRFSHDITDLLKPSMPKNEGPWKFIVRHQITDAGGGDFILHRRTPTNLTGVLADVMGHGKQAKFFSCVYAGYLHSIFRMQADMLDASSFLKYLSRSIDDDPMLENMIMTCQCFQFFSEGVLKVASAGHPRPIILRHHGAELMDVMGPLPGLGDNHDYDMKSVRLDFGDKIIFMTDGFMEAFDSRGGAAQELLNAVNLVPGLSATELADHLWREFQDKQKKQNVSKDDATIIIAEYGETI